MTEKNENNAFTVPTRLKMAPSPQLDRLIKQFYNEQTRQALNAAGKSVPLYSQRLVRIRIQETDNKSSYKMARDMIDKDRYEVSLGRIHKDRVPISSEIKLRDHGKQGIEVGAYLMPNEHQKAAMLRPPLYDELADERINIFVLLQRERLVGKQALNAAYDEFQSVAFMNQHNGIANPGLFVTDFEYKAMTERPSRLASITPARSIAEPVIENAPLLETLLDDLNKGSSDKQAS